MTAGDADRELEELRVRERTYRQLFDAASDAIFVHDAETGLLVDVNQTMLDMYGLTRDEALGVHPASMSLGATPYALADAAEWLRKARDEGPQLFEWMARHRSGKLFPVEVSLSRVDLGDKRRILAVVRDISRRRWVEDALEYRNRFESVIADISTRFVSAPVSDLDLEIDTALGEIGRFANVDAGYLMRFTNDDTTFGMTHLWNAGALGTKKALLGNLRVADMPWWMNQILAGRTVAVSSVDLLPEQAQEEKRIISSQGIQSIIDVPVAFQGKVVGFLGFSSTVDHRVWSPGEQSLLRFVGQVFISEIERRRAEQELKNSEEQFRQAQKMEAIGRLAGGVAHDFNNLLTGILGGAELVLADLPEDHPSREDVLEIAATAERAAALTRQLLAFSRKEVIQPTVVNLNAVIDQSRKMLARIIGEDVELVFRPAGELWNVTVDPSQIDQILVNLATNARDAMPGGGKLSIDTGNVEFDEASAGQHPWIQPGAYVMLSVTDTGCGIPKELQAQVFEPFFSTKPEGKGTGLGLSTVYGIVKQNGGFLTLYSEVGIGTTVRVCFPRTQSDVVAAAAPAKKAPPGGKETILLVEDEEVVRNLARRMLERQGYTVVAAADGLEACRHVEELGERFELLVTDVVMPHLNGPDLYERLQRTQPDLRCVFMSGYAESTIVHHGVMDKDKRLLQKPFSSSSLLNAVREALQKE